MRKSYGQAVVLKGISITVPEGSIYGFLGPNGAGKSTTMRILMGLVNPTSGTASLLGEPVRPGLNVQLKSRVAYLAEEPVFPEQLSGLEVLELAGAIYGLASKVSKSRAAELLDRFGLAGSARKRVAAYSRGMRQRLGLAATLLPRPQVMVLDEPVSALDPEGRFEVLSLVKDMGGAATVFFSSHVLQDVERVCDRVAILNHGEILVEAGLPDLLHRYTRPGVRLTLREGQGRAAGNILTGKPWVSSLKQDGDTLVVLAATGHSSAMEEKILPELVAAGVTVTSLQPLVPGLEQIFLEITKFRQPGGESSCQH